MIGLQVLRYNRNKHLSPIVRHRRNTAQRGPRSAVEICDNSSQTVTVSNSVEIKLKSKHASTCHCFLCLPLILQHSKTVIFTGIASKLHNCPVLRSYGFYSCQSTFLCSAFQNLTMLKTISAFFVLSVSHFPVNFPSLNVGRTIFRILQILLHAVMKRDFN